MNDNGNGADRLHRVFNPFEHENIARAGNGDEVPGAQNKGAAKTSPATVSLDDFRYE